MSSVFSSGTVGNVTGCAWWSDVHTKKYLIECFGNTSEGLLLKQNDPVRKDAKIILKVEM